MFQSNTLFKAKGCSRQNVVPSKSLLDAKRRRHRRAVGYGMWSSYNATKLNFLFGVIGGSHLERLYCIQMNANRISVSEIHSEQLYCIQIEFPSQVNHGFAFGLALMHQIEFPSQRGGVSARGPPPIAI